MDAVDEPAPSSPAPAPAPRWRSVLILLAGLVVMASGLIAWGRSGPSAAELRAHTRDAALIAAKQDIATLNTLDYHDVEAGIATWRARSTGKLHDQLAAVTPAQMRLLAEQKKVSVGHVVDAGLLSLGNDTATVIASIDVTIKDATRPDSAPTVKRNRFSADLVRVGDQWKLESLAQVPVNIS